MSIYELKILFDLNPESKSKVLCKYANKFKLSYFFVDSEDGHCYWFDRYGKEKDVSLIHEINEDMISRDIKKIVIPKNVMRIKISAFEDCNELKSVTIPDSVINIGYYAFGYCYSLMRVTIPNSITTIGSGAFYGCSGLTSVTIPNSVANIGYSVFYSCDNLKSLVFKGKTIDQVKAMKTYPFGIKDESIIKAELS